MLLTRLIQTKCKLFFFQAAHGIRDFHVTGVQTCALPISIADPEAAIWLAWEHILDIIDVALLMAVAIGVLASLAIAHTLAPARSIVAALQRMALGQYRNAVAVPFRCAGGFDERRALARELHDEFGQNLAAILAFASTIETAGAPEGDGNGVAQDARMITKATLHIMACLRDTLKRLRHPPAEELGLEASLVDLVDRWRSQDAARPIVQLDLRGDLTDVRGTVAATAYRVAQECLTNSLRHGAAREISLRIERRTGEENSLLICVEDDGGGDAANVTQSAGFGLTGIRERVAALGGSLSIARATRGLSVAATIPIAA